MSPTRISLPTLGAAILLSALLTGCPSSVPTAGSADGVTSTDTAGDDSGGGLCVPQCGWRACGVDPICGANCGVCGAGEVCDKGSCIPDGCVPNCDAVACGADPVCGAFCGDCAPGQRCEEGVCVEGACTPDCSERQCGPDPACFMSCGTCADNERCEGGVCVEGACEPNCAGLTCGPDPVCGQSCGACEADATCVDGACCAPQCDGLECGSDGCGGTCGTCAEGCVCGPGGACQCGCVAECGDRECGPDPVCGQSCGTCDEGCSCSDGQCACCEPECGDRECGPDPACGESCGECSGDDVCVAGQCQPPTPPGACDNPDDLAALNAVDTVPVAQSCLLDSGCGDDSACLAECVREQTGVSESCSECFGELSVCGLDACIAQCVADPGGFSCMGCLGEQCFPEFEACAGIRAVQDCVPRCEGRTCGDDGCGGSCGACEGQLACVDGQCVATVEGACNNPEDLELLNSADASAVAQRCLLDSGCGRDADCLGQCVAGETEISDACAACYGTLSVCGLDNCMAPCVASPGGAECIACLDRACLAEFSACSGVEFNTCVPMCEDRECGPDPVCGQSCGECSDGERCVEGACSAQRGDACANPEDLAILGETDLAGLATTCLLGGCGVDRSCLEQCAVDETGMSAACSVCVAEAGMCAVSACIGACYADSSSPECSTCILESCAPGFELCAGVEFVVNP